jgi:hypothetical protein
MAQGSRGTGGRPDGKSQHLYTPEQLEERCNSYFTDCEERERKPTRPGLILWLDMSDDTLRNYEDGKGGYKGLSEPIKKAMRRIQDDLEQRTDTMSLFRLKQPCYGGYTDKPSNDSGQLNVNITFGGGEGRNFGK